MLYLLPNLLHRDASCAEQFPASIERIVAEIRGLIAEDFTEARRYLKHFGKFDIPVALLNEHTTEAEMRVLLEPLKRGERWGLISDAGLPCLADPGACLVSYARQVGIPIQAFPGPSAIFLALLLSGMQAQRFAFHGYLPREEEKRKRMLKALEKRARQEEAPQLFIETPYRNQAMLLSALSILDSETLFVAAVDLTASTETIHSFSVREWKKKPLPDIHKRPAVFLIK